MLTDLAILFIPAVTLIAHGLEIIDISDFFS